MYWKFPDPRLQPQTSRTVGIDAENSRTCSNAGIVACLTAPHTSSAGKLGPSNHYGMKQNRA